MLKDRGEYLIWWLNISWQAQYYHVFGRRYHRLSIYSCFVCLCLFLSGFNRIVLSAVWRIYSQVVCNCCLMWIMWGCIVGMYLFSVCWVSKAVFLSVYLVFVDLWGNCVIYVMTAAVGQSRLLIIILKVSSTYAWDRKKKDILLHFSDNFEVPLTSLFLYLLRL